MGTKFTQLKNYLSQNDWLVFVVFLMYKISSTVNVHKHREANMNKKISDTFRAAMPRLGTNKKDMILYTFAQNHGFLLNSKFFTNLIFPKICII